MELPFLVGLCIASIVLWIARFWSISVCAHDRKKVATALRLFSESYFSMELSPTSTPGTRKLEIQNGKQTADTKWQYFSLQALESKLQWQTNKFQGQASMSKKGMLTPINDKLNRKCEIQNGVCQSRKDLYPNYRHMIERKSKQLLSHHFQGQDFHSSCHWPQYLKPEIHYCGHQTGSSNISASQTMSLVSLIFQIPVLLKK